LSGKRW